MFCWGEEKGSSIASRIEERGIWREIRESWCRWGIVRKGRGEIGKDEPYDF